ncbi:MAG: universal stress protein UspA [Cytophagaceae bacterium]|nr:universal stress protein UspA [Cytophagaceae bacterium]|tara:strand:- start:11136 stop:11930 length:795 start_codon:yes stop_codon:yes gene_type:complete
MKTVFLPLGDKPISHYPVQYAIEISAALGATLIVSRLYREDARSRGLLKGNLTVAEISSQEIQKELENFELKGDYKIIPVEGDDLIEAVAKFHQKENIDLIVLPPRHQDIHEAYFLGSVSGGFVKKTDIPALIVPEGYGFKPVKNILMAIKSGIIKDEKVLLPLEDIMKAEDAIVRLLQVKTPDYLPEDSEFNEVLGKLISAYKSSENATLFQGLLEHLNENYPDMLCVFRRKRGFFTKLWEESRIKKSDFESRIPLLVLKEAE